jgi:hypothetical protein
MIKILLGTANKGVDFDICYFTHFDDGALYLCSIAGKKRLVMPLFPS